MRTSIRFITCNYSTRNYTMLNFSSIEYFVSLCIIFANYNVNDLLNNYEIYNYKAVMKYTNNSEDNTHTYTYIYILTLYIKGYLNNPTCIQNQCEISFNELVIILLFYQKRTLALIIFLINLHMCVTSSWNNVICKPIIYEYRETQYFVATRDLRYH